MRESEPIPSRTAATSAPMKSHRLAIWFMKEMRVASMALAAYLVISALRISMTIMRFCLRMKGSYNSFMISAVRTLSVPITTRSGFMKSSMAAPSLRNSGLETTSNSKAAPRAANSSLTASRTLSAVPTGTVDLSTMILKPFMARPISLATPRTYFRSAEPSSPGGVPTAMKQTRDACTASAISVVKKRRPSAWLRSTISFRPGS